MEKYKAHINVDFLFHFILKYTSNNFNVLVSGFGAEYGTEVKFGKPLFTQFLVGRNQFKKQAYNISDGKNCKESSLKILNYYYIIKLLKEDRK